MRRGRRRPWATATLSGLLLAGASGIAAPAAAQTSAPVITTTGPFSVNEGTTSVATLAATDDDTDQGDLTWSIPAGSDGGDDASSFALSQAGVLTFAAAKDYEIPDDDDKDRTWEVTVQVSDGTDSDKADLLVTLLNVAELTAIKGPSTVSFAENGWARVASFTASSEEDRASIQWSLGGDDADLFELDPIGVVRFLLDPVSPGIFAEPPDFEAPVDDGADNTYETTLTATAGSTVSQPFSLQVTVTDVDEDGEVSLSSTRPALGAALTAVLSDPDGVTAESASWKWERSTGRNSWVAIASAAAASYTPAAADTNAFLRVTATYADEHGTGKTASEVAPNVVMGPLLTGLTAETDDSRANAAQAMYPAFAAATLHYGIGCNGDDTLTLTASAPATARVAVDGVQAAGAPVTVTVTEDSDVAVRVTDATGAATTYVVHCLPDAFFQIETVALVSTGLPEDLILLHRAGYVTAMDRNGVPRVHRASSNSGVFAVRFHRVGAGGAYRYGFLEDGSYTILDEDFEDVADDVRTVSPLTRLDAHDFQILEDGNYLVMSWEPATRDFSGIDLPYAENADVSAVAVRDSTFQIVTPAGQADFTWNSWGRMAIEDCVQHRFPLTLRTDPDARTPHPGYAHLNGMHLVDGVLAASMRGCSKVLGIDLRAGATRGDVLWRMGRTNLSEAEWSARDIGPRPLDFVNDPEGEFCGQHTARFLPNGNVFLFDNGVQCAIDPSTFKQLGRSGNDFSRAVEYALDLENHEAVFVRDHSLRGERKYVGYATGNVDALDNGDWLVSWGRILEEDGRFPDNEMATVVDPATGQEKLTIRFTELPSEPRQRRINATALPAEALAPQPLALTAKLLRGSTGHSGAGAAPQVVVAFNQPVADFGVSSPSLSVQGGSVRSVRPHLAAGEPANAYAVVLAPDGAGPVTFSLTSGRSCASSGVCTAGGTTLSTVPAPHAIPFSGGGVGGGVPGGDGDEDEGDGDDDGGGDDGGGGPTGGSAPRAAVAVDTDCDGNLCRALTGLPIRFEDASAGFVRYRRWDFGDGRTSTSQVLTHAWSTPGFYEATLWTSNGTVESTASLTFLVEAATPAGTCAADANTRCLGDSRYSVAVDWWTPDGTAGKGVVAPVGTNDSGLFSFFEPNNWEILVKVLDGCALNGHVWVYGASTTDLGYAIRVSDTATGAAKLYRNEQGTPAAAITDATAFPLGCGPAP